MEWVKLPTDVYADDRLIGLTHPAFRLYIHGLAWAGHRETDGFIPANVLRIIGGNERVAKALVEAGIWTAVDGGFTQTWTKQSSKSEQTSAREAAKLRKRKSRESAAYASGHGVSNAVGHAVTSPARLDKIREESNPPVVPPPGDAKPKRAKAVKHGWPDGWAPSEAHRAKATALGLDVRQEAELFETFHRSKGNVFADWNLAFVTWLGNAKRFSRPSVLPFPGRVMQRDAEVPEWAIAKGLVK